MAWDLFQWGSRGLWYTTPEEGIYVAHVFLQNGIRVVLRASRDTGQQFLHVFHMRGPNAQPDYADCLAAAQVVAGWWGSNYRNMVGGQITGRDVVATGMDAVPAAQATVLLTLAGARAGASSPGNVSCALKFFSHQSGRRNKGGVRGWTPVNTDWSEDRFTPAYITAMLGVFGNLLTLANTAGYPIHIASLTTPRLVPVSGVIALDDFIDSQRRRLIGRGSI